jgi:hypothetical protein
MTVDEIARLRKSVLYVAYDVFQTHRQVCCPACGQAIRDAGGNSQRIMHVRRILSEIFNATVQDVFDPLSALSEWESFIERAGEYAAHVFGQESVPFVVFMLRQHAERVQKGEHREAGNEPNR